MANTFAAPDSEFSCLCAADNAEIEVIGMGTFTGGFKGEMVVHAGSEIIQNNLTTLLLRITKHETKGTAADIGAINVSHDFSRPAPDSFIQELSQGTGFPACQEMHVNIKVTLEALPGVVLRNTATGVLKSYSQQAFPPENAEYVLLSPMDLEDEANPGQVLARMVRYTARINPYPTQASSQSREQMGV